MEGGLPLAVAPNVASHAPNRTQLTPSCPHTIFRWLLEQLVRIPHKFPELFIDFGDSSFPAALFIDFSNSIIYPSPLLSFVSLFRFYLSPAEVSHASLNATSVQKSASFQRCYPTTL